MDATRRLEHRIDTCPHCGEAHVVALDVVVATDSPPLAAGAVSFFAAPPSVATSAVTGAEWSVGVVCAQTGKHILATVPVRPGPGERVVAVRLAGGAAGPAGQPEPSVEALLATELTELVKQSSAAARDFGKTMLTASLVAIPAVFGVAGFLGAQRVGGRWAGWTGAASALLFLLAGCGFAAAMRPWLTAYEGLLDYAADRERRVLAVNRMLIAATVTFGLAAMSAIALFGIVLVRS